MLRILTTVLLAAQLTLVRPAQAGKVYDATRAAYITFWGCVDYIASPFGIAPGQKIRSWIGGVREQISPLYLQEVDRRGELVSLGDESRGFFSFRVNQYRGMGGWGIVYDINILDFDSRFLWAHPQLFEDGRARRGLVAKFARHTPLYRKSQVAAELEKERSETLEIEQALLKHGIARIEFPEVYYVQGEPFPLLIKPSVEDSLEFGEALTESGELEPERLQALERDIWEPALALYQHTGIAIDMGAGNVYWSPESRRWGMYELTRGVPESWRCLREKPGQGFGKYLEKLKLEWARQNQRGNRWNANLTRDLLTLPASSQ